MKRLLPVVLLLAVTPLFGWGEAGHYIVNDAATRTLPNDMPSFFYAAAPELIHLAYAPDRLRGAGESADAANAPDHFVDYEYLEGLKLTPDRYRFIGLLGTSGTLRKHGLYTSSTGFLPWRIAELSETLTAFWRMWRAAPAGSPERAFIEHSIVNTAGMLGHFIGDASQPLHTTMNYNGWVMPNPNRYNYDCDAHSRFESNFISRVMTADDVIPEVAPPAARSDYFATAIDFVKQSNVFVEPLYRIDRDGGFAYTGPISPMAKDFAAARLAAGASMLRDYWWSSWVNSARPPVLRGEAPPPED